MDSRTDILNAALRLFAAYGYDAVGVQAIVEAVGVTKPTLYHYFGSKRGLFETLVQEQSAPLLNDVRVATTYAGDVTRSIETIIRAYFDYAEENPIFYRMLLSMWFAPPSSEYFPSVHALFQQQFLLIEDMFRQAANDHGNMKGRHQQYAVSLKGMIDTYIAVAFQGHIDLKQSNVEYRLGHQFMHGIFS